MLSLSGTFQNPWWAGGIPQFAHPPTGLPATARRMTWRRLSPNADHPAICSTAAPRPLNLEGQHRREVIRPYCRLGDIPPGLTQPARYQGSS